ncbi:hypothetical protein [Longimycelium tulufanense]|nr:hypothetical protein [Longimycelium tulufanense]
MIPVPMNERMQAKIKALLALIEHQRTSEEERDAARRALKRINDQREKHEKAWPTGRLYNPGAWKGSKYEQARNLTLTEIARLIRADLKLARKIGQSVDDPAVLAVPDPIADAPEQIKYSVRTRYYSGGGSIDLVIKNVPEIWGWTVEPHPLYGEQERWKIATAAMAALYHEVETIYHAYNYDNSDAMTDYFERHYWGHVETEPRIHIPRR